MFNKYDHIKEKVETYIDLKGNLIICNPSANIHWEYYEPLPLVKALTELLEYQLANGFSWIQPDEIKEKKGSLILGWDVQRNDMGGFLTCYDIFKLAEFQEKKRFERASRREALEFLPSCLTFHNNQYGFI